MIYTKFNQTPFNRPEFKAVISVTAKTDINFDAITSILQNIIIITTVNKTDIDFLPTTSTLINQIITVPAGKTNIEFDSLILIPITTATSKKIPKYYYISPAQVLISSIAIKQKASIELSSAESAGLPSIISQAQNTNIELLTIQSTALATIISQTEKEEINFISLVPAITPIALIFVDPTVSNLQRKVLLNNPQSYPTVPNDREVN